MQTQLQAQYTTCHRKHCGNQGHQLGGLEGSTDPQGFMTLTFSPVNRTFETMLLLQKQYIT